MKELVLNNNKITDIEISEKIKLEKLQILLMNENKIDKNILKMLSSIKIMDKLNN